MQEIETGDEVIHTDGRKGLVIEQQRSAPDQSMIEWESGETELCRNSELRKL